MDLEAGRQALEALEAFWHAKRAGRLMPRRGDFDFHEFMPWMGNIRIIQVMPEPPRFKVTLDGAGIVNTAGVDLTGKFLDVVYGSERLRFLLDGYIRIMAGEGPVYETLHPNGAVVNFGKIVRLLLPCGGEERIEHIIYCEYAHDVMHWGSSVFADIGELKL